MEKYVHGFDDDDNFPFVSHGKHILVKPDFGYGDHGWASQVSRTTQAKLVQVHGEKAIVSLDYINKLINCLLQVAYSLLEFGFSCLSAIFFPHFTNDFGTRKYN